MAKYPEEHLYNLAIADPAVTALIGDRIYKDAAPQTAANPCVTYTRIGTDRVRKQNGPDGLAMAEIQISCFADDSTQVLDVADALRQLLNGVQDSFFLGTNIGEEFSTDPFYDSGEELPAYQQILILSCHYRDVTP